MPHRHARHLLDADALRLRRIAEADRHSPYVVLGTPLVAAMVVAVGWPALPQDVLILWLAGAMLVALGHFVVHRRRRDDEWQPLDGLRSQRRAEAGAMLYAVLWAAPAMPAATLAEPNFQFAAAALLSGLLGAAAAVLATLPRAFTLFAMLASGGFCGVLLHNGGPSSLVLACAIAAFTLVMGHWAQRRSRLFEEGEREHALLIEQLVRADLARDELAMRLQHVGAAAGGWAWEFDQDQRIAYVSDSIARLTGSPADLYFGRSQEELRNPETERLTWQSYRELLRMQQPFRDFEYKLRGPRGLRWMRNCGVPVFDADGAFQGYRGLALDVTDDVEAREVAWHAYGLVVETFDHLDAAVAVRDADGALSFSNAAFRDLFADAGGDDEAEYDEDEEAEAGPVPGMPWDQAIAGADWLETRDDNGWCRHPDGRWFEVTESDGPLDGRLVVLRDVSVTQSRQQRRAETQARQVEAFEQMLLTTVDTERAAWQDSLAAWEDTFVLAQGAAAAESALAAIAREQAHEGERAAWLAALPEPAVEAAIARSGAEDELALAQAAAAAEAEQAMLTVHAAAAETESLSALAQREQASASQADGIAWQRQTDRLQEDLLWTQATARGDSETVMHGYARFARRQIREEQARASLALAELRRESDAALAALTARHQAGAAEATAKLERLHREIEALKAGPPADPAIDPAVAEELAPSEDGSPTHDAARETAVRFDPRALLQDVARSLRPLAERHGRTIVPLSWNDVPHQVAARAGSLRLLLFNLAADCLRQGGQDPVRSPVRIDLRAGAASVGRRLDFTIATAAGPGESRGEGTNARLIEALGASLDIERGANRQVLRLSLPVDAVDDEPASHPRHRLVLWEPHPADRRIVAARAAELGHEVAVAETRDAIIDALRGQTVPDALLFAYRPAPSPSHELALALRALPGLGALVPRIGLVAPADLAGVETTAPLDDILRKPVYKAELAAALARAVGARAMPDETPEPRGDSRFDRRSA